MPKRRWTRKRYRQKHKAQTDRFICHKSIAEVRLQQRRNSYKNNNNKNDTNEIVQPTRRTQKFHDHVMIGWCVEESSYSFVRCVSMFWICDLDDSDDREEEANNARSRQGNLLFPFRINLHFPQIRINYSKIRKHHDNFAMESSQGVDYSSILRIIIG